MVVEEGLVYRQGDRDAGPNGDIRAAQTALNRLGTGVGEIDGIYGRNTMNAVQDAQAMFGLPRTGVLDQVTMDRLNNLTDEQVAFFTSEAEETAEAAEQNAPLADATPITEPETPADAGQMSSRLDSKLRETNQYERMLYSDNEQERSIGIQGALSRLGYNTRGVDGVLGANTRRAIREFQENNGLEVTGNVDEATLTSLRSAAPTPYEYSEVIGAALPEIGDAESTEPHLGGADYREKGITLGYGILPDSGLKYDHNGTIVEIPQTESRRWPALQAAGVTLENFDPEKVISKDAVKAGIRRGDYTSDLAWTNAVLRSFEIDMDAAIEADGVDPNDIKPEARAGILSFGWNAGQDAYNYNLMAPAYETLANEEEPNFDTVGTGMLQVFTSNGIVIRGLANRRALDYNMVANAYNSPTITSYTPIRLSNGNAGFRYRYSNGDTREIDTYKNYENKASFGSFKKHLNTEFNIEEE